MDDLINYLCTLFAPCMGDNNNCAERRLRNLCRLNVLKCKTITAACQISAYPCISAASMSFDLNKFNPEFSQ